MLLEHGDRFTAFNKVNKALSDKGKVSEALWNESMIYEDYACDNSTE